MANRQDRLNRIVELLAGGEPQRLSQLAHVLDVSVMTIRRDAEFLVDRGDAYLLHGALVATGENVNSFSSRYLLNNAKSVHSAEKAAIGRRAAEMVGGRDTVAIDGGSTTELLAAQIPPDIDATLIAYSINVFLKVSETSHARLILAGGEYHRDTKMFRGSGTISLLKTMRATKAFISASGVSVSLGVTCSNHFEYEIKRSLIDHSLQRILVVDHSKFDHAENAYFADISEFDIVVTDRQPPRPYVRHCRENDVALIVAED